MWTQTHQALQSSCLVCISLNSLLNEAFCLEMFLSMETQHFRKTLQTRAPSLSYDLGAISDWIKRRRAEVSSIFLPPRKAVPEL